jgi:predicted transcriptional regulator
MSISLSVLRHYASILRKSIDETELFYLHFVAIRETILSMKLGTVIRKWRTMEERTLRDVAKEIGTSAATLMRVEQGAACDSDTLATILVWLVKSKP